MNFIEVEGKTVEDAIIDAKVKLGVASNELEYEVIEKGSNGFLGIGSKNAVIKARVKVDSFINEEKIEEEKTQESEEIVEEVKSETENSKEIKEIDVTEHFDRINKFISDIADKMNEEVKVFCSEGEDINSININLEGPNMGLFIGRRGQTLDSIQYLVSIIVNQESSSYIRIKLDTENYRERRKATLENLASNMARRAIRNDRRVALDPMNPYERRIIHSYLQEDKRVDTFSEGVEPYRKVVIIPNKVENN